MQPIASYLFKIASFKSLEKYRFLGDLLSKLNSTNVGHKIAHS